jgi:diguanylate cyclase (GGDEF)-like protein
MINARHRDEEGRLAALHRYQVLDTAAEAPFDKITAIVKTVLDVPICAVSLVDRDRQWFKSSVGLSVPETPRSVSFCAHTIQTDQPMVIADATLDIRFSANALVVGAPFIRSYAGVPLQSPDGYNLGALCAIDTRPRRFDETQVALLRNFAALVVDELELRRIADRDHLTGALTRRGFLQAMEKEIERFKRYGRPSALLMLDVDRFKSINDRFGHPAGDIVLQAVAACCDATVRPSDVFGRLGGEEFGILLPETTADEAMAGAERFRRAIEALRFPTLDDVLATASFGVAPLTADRCDANRWLVDADAALYRAKHAGRNRCVASDRRLHVVAA